MKKPSYEDLRTRNEHLEKQNTLLLFYLSDSGITFPPVKYTFVISDCGGYTGTMFRPASGCGGYVIIRDLRLGTCPTIEYLDNIDTKWPEVFRILADRLRVIRQRILDEEARKTHS
jgi:hypothetical protein